MRTIANLGKGKQALSGASASGNGNRDRFQYLIDQIKKGLQNQMAFLKKESLEESKNYTRSSPSYGCEISAEISQ